MASQIMTVQSLLREASQLSPKEQLQLATQLLQLIDQQLESSAKARKSIPVVNVAAVNIAAAESPEIDTLEHIDVNHEEGSIDYLLAHPIPVRNFKPMSRDEVYDRC